MKVRTDIGGSICVIQIRDDWEEYIDARNDVRTPSFVLIEYVRAGQVRFHDTVHRDNAPLTMIQLARKRM